MTPFNPAILLTPQHRIGPIFRGGNLEWSYRIGGWTVDTATVVAGGSGAYTAWRAARVARSAAKGGLNGRGLWRRASTLDDHFRRHGADFGAKSADDYAQQATDFLQRSQADRLPTKIGPDGTIRVYDPASNSFGSFNPDGTTKTFFKPSKGQAFWDGQPGSEPWSP